MYIYMIVFNLLSIYVLMVVSLVYFSMYKRVHLKVRVKIESSFIPSNVHIPIPNLVLNVFFYQNDFNDILLLICDTYFVINLT